MTKGGSLGDEEFRVTAIAEEESIDKTPRRFALEFPVTTRVEPPSMIRDPLIFKTAESNVRV